MQSRSAKKAQKVRVKTLRHPYETVSKHIIDSTGLSVISRSTCPTTWQWTLDRWPGGVPHENYWCLGSGKTSQNEKANQFLVQDAERGRAELPFNTSTVIGPSSACVIFKLLFIESYLSICTHLHAMKWILNLPDAPNELARWRLGYQSLNSMSCKELQLRTKRPTRYWDWSQMARIEPNWKMRFQRWWGH